MLRFSNNGWAQKIARAMLKLMPQPGSFIAGCLSATWRECSLTKNGVLPLYHQILPTPLGTNTTTSLNWIKKPSNKKRRCLDYRAGDLGGLRSGGGRGGLGLERHRGVMQEDAHLKGDVQKHMDVRLRCEVWGCTVHCLGVWVQCSDWGFG